LDFSHARQRFAQLHDLRLNLRLGRSVPSRILRRLRGEKSNTRAERAYMHSLARGLIAAVRGDPSARREYENAKSLHATVAPLRVLERRLPSR